MKEMYLDICKTLRCTPNSAILESFTEDPEFFLRDRLSLPQNYLGSKGVRSILLLVYKNSNIYNLNLVNQGIRSDCAKDIAEVFEYHSRIHTIDLSNNRIGVQGAKALLQLFEKNEAIKVINLEGNPIPEEIMEKFRALTEKKKEMRFYSNYGGMIDEWAHVNIEESASLAPIFTPTASQTNLSFRDDMSRVTTHYEHDDFFYKGRTTPFS
jgi:acyl-CoA synthetase (AMP-forming)/AMP-acid ligase II